MLRNTTFLIFAVLVLWVCQSHLSSIGEHTCFAGTATVNRLTGSVRRVVHKEHGCNNWKKTVACLLVLPRSQTKIIRGGGRYDPQLVKRSSEWVSESYNKIRPTVHYNSVVEHAGVKSYPIKAQWTKCDLQYGLHSLSLLQSPTSQTWLLSNH